MPRRLAVLFLVAALPAHAEEPNLSISLQGHQGSAAQLVVAHRVYSRALASGDALPLLAAIHLARAVTLRPATGWEKTTTGELGADTPVGRVTAPDPASAGALVIARNLAEEDPDLQDIVYDLDAQVPGGRTLTAVFAETSLGPGQTDTWRLPLFGEVAAEIALIGDGDGPLTLTVSDATGATICAPAESVEPMLCSLTPARNGFFSVSLSNPGTTVNSYRLIGN